MRATALIPMVLLPWLLATPVQGATAYASFDPSSASPGARVQVRIDGTECRDWNADALEMRLDRDFDAPADAEVRLVRSGPPGTFSFVVPDLAPGRYNVAIDCQAGAGESWQPFLLGIEGSIGPFTVLPDTSTVAAPVSSGVAAAAPPWLPILAGLVALVLVGRRRRPAA